MRRNGFTMAELLVSLAVLSIVSIYLTNMLTQQNRAYVVVEDVTEAQGNARAILDILERDLRETAQLAPEGSAVCGVDKTDGPDVLYVTRSEVFNFEDDRITEYDGLGSPVLAGFSGTGNNEIIQLVPALLGQPDPMARDYDPYHDTDGDGAKDSDFAPGGSVIVVDPDHPDKGAACGVIVTGGLDIVAKRLTVNFDVGGENPGLGSNVVVLPATRYSVSVDDELLRDGAVLAEGVEDLQVAYFFDLFPQDGEVDDDEVPGSDGDPVYESDDFDNSQLREVRINVSVRSRRGDLRLPGAVPQAVENHAPAAVPDGFRRRVLTASVRPRNVGHRPTFDIY
jgi:prepilin-type N-terminal cleavage/methylation domain-containing protein